MANLPLAFAELLGGGVLLTAGITGAAIQDVFAGNIGLGGGGSASTAAPAGGAAPSGRRQGDVAMSDLTQVGSGYGWGAADLADWWRLIAQESGGRADAVNPSSGAFGIGQFHGSTKTEYASKGATSSNPLKQLEAMAAYIHDRYGTPANAWAHEQAHNWY